jgi:uncharacterized membrane protein YcaP (DUF421 family)
VLIENGRVHEDRLAAVKIRLDDILENGRLEEGIERLDQIKHAILERSGSTRSCRRTTASQSGQDAAGTTGGGSTRP